VAIPGSSGEKNDDITTVRRFLAAGLSMMMISMGISGSD